MKQVEKDRRTGYGIRERVSFAQTMKLSFIKPRRELEPYVESIWVLESPNGLPASDSCIAAPNGCPKLIFLYENAMTVAADGKVQTNRDKKLYFIGNKYSPAFIRTSPRKTGMVGVEFHPHGALPVFGIPIWETFNDLWEAEMLFGNPGRQIQEILNNLETASERVVFIQEQLVSLLHKNVRDNRLVEYCVKTLKSADGLIAIQELQQKTGYSRRYLDLLFNEHVGLAPKVLAGIFRFQRFYRKWAEGQSFEQLKEDLYDYYYDQAHFTKEFKKMTGHSPREYSLEVSNEFGRRFSLR